MYLSAASVWEVVIKHGLGKLPLPAPPADYLPQQRDAHGVDSLPIDEGAMKHLANLPALHRDPFDRQLIAQALQHGLTITTVDPQYCLVSGISARRGLTYPELMRTANDVAACMYYTGLDPFTGEEVYIAKNLRDRKMQRALLQFFKSENSFKELHKAGRQEKIR